MAKSIRIVLWLEGQPFHAISIKQESVPGIIFYIAPPGMV